MEFEKFHHLLKARPFKSTNNNKNQHFIFRFKYGRVYRDEKHLCDYELREEGGKFIMTFDNRQEPLWTGDFKNVLVIIDKEREVINSDPKSFTGQYEVILESQ